MLHSALLCLVSLAALQEGHMLCQAMQTGVPKLYCEQL